MIWQVFIPLRYFLLVLLYFLSPIELSLWLYRFAYRTCLFCSREQRSGFFGGLFKGGSVLWHLKSDVQRGVS
jgi:hypothetical protein